MSMRLLGQDGPKVHPIGIGAMSFSDFYGATTEADSHAILAKAMEVGVNHIDTANVYGMGKSERAIGSYLKANPAARDHFVIATKGSIRRREDGKGNFFDNSKEHLEETLNESLGRLGVDAVDLFYIHRRDPSVEIEEVTETLAEFVKAGKIKSIGFSEIAPSTLRRAMAVHPVAAVQSEYSLWTRSPEMGLVQTCAELRVALVAFSPLGRSILTDTPVTPDAIGEIGFLKNNPRFIEPNLSANLAASQPLRDLARDMEISTAGLAIAWAAAKGDHVLPIPGTRSTAHFAEIMEGTRVLSADEVAAVETALPIGWAHGERYTPSQWVGPEKYC